MPKSKKVRDFEKQKLKVGKKKPENANATSTSFQTKTLVLHSQHKAASLASYIALTRHHQAPVRRQALANIGEVLHIHEQSLGDILRAVSPLIVDSDHLVRQAMLQFMKKVRNDLLFSHTLLLTVHIHAAMTHITPGIRADSSQFLEILINKSPMELVRRSFVKTLSLFFPLMGWSMKGNTQAGTVSSTLSFGKLAPKARTSHLKSLNMLLDNAFKPDVIRSEVAYHPETENFMIPPVGNPFDINVTDDVEARMEAFEMFKDPLVRNLNNVVKEGGETGRIASKIISEIESF